MIRVSIDQVMREVYHAHSEAIEVFLGEGRRSFPYSFVQFRRDMNARGLLTDYRAIRSKWDALVANRVVIELPSDDKSIKGELVVEKFREYAYPSYGSGYVCTHTSSTPTSDERRYRWPTKSTPS